MRALVNTPNGPTPVEFRDLPEPQLQANEALIEVRAFSLNRGELTLFKNLHEGWRPGQDIAGTVLRSPDPTSLPIGARIVAIADRAGWAERAVVPLTRIACLPDTVSFEDAAALPVAGITALRTLRFGDPLLGRRVLITGAGGGVGTLAVQLAVRAGARVTAVARASSTETMRALGAHATIDQVSGAQGRYHLILESVGGASLAAALERIATGGTVVVFGNSSREPTTFSFATFRQAQNARIQSFFSFTSGPEEAFAPDLALLAGLVAEGALRPQITVRDWDQINIVAAELEARKLPGKAVFRIG
ncbi:MAG: zinc-binding dehydrogenase [Rhodopila sp.]